MRHLALLCLFASALAQETRNAAAEGVRGVNQEGSATVKNVDPRTTAVNAEKVQGVEKVEGVKATGAKGATPPPPPPPHQAKGVEKVEGVKTVEGIKGAGTKAVPPPPAAKAVKPPPVGTAAHIEPGKIGTGGTIKAIEGVKGLQTEKLKNLEAALQIKEKPEHNGGGKAKAAAELITQPGPLAQPGPKQDGRTLFPEQKIPDVGS